MPSPAHGSTRLTALHPSAAALLPSPHIAESGIKTRIRDTIDTMLTWIVEGRQAKFWPGNGPNGHRVGA